MRAARAVCTKPRTTDIFLIVVLHTARVFCVGSRASGSTAGSNYFVRILSTLDREVLKPNTSVALHRHSHSVVEILPPESDSTIQLMQERPDVTYHDIGGMDMQKQEVSCIVGFSKRPPATCQV